MKIKYIVIDFIAPVLMSIASQHSDFGRYKKVTSAGFCSVDQNVDTGKFEVHCWGESISLNIKSDPEHDARVIGNLFKEF